MKITFQNQTVTDTENRTESIQTEKNTWGRDKIQRNKKSVNANTLEPYTRVGRSQCLWEMKRIIRENP